MAADRARLYEAERRAREEAETLFRISDALSATQLDLETIVQRVTDEATRLTGAEFGAFFYNVLDAQGRVVPALHAVGRAQGSVREVRAAPQHADLRRRPSPGKGSSASTT